VQEPRNELTASVAMLIRIIERFVLHLVEGHDSCPFLTHGPSFCPPSCFGYPRIIIEFGDGTFQRHSADFITGSVALDTTIEADSTVHLVTLAQAN